MIFQGKAKSFNTSLISAQGKVNSIVEDSNPIFNCDDFTSYNGTSSTILSLHVGNTHYGSLLQETKTNQNNKTIMSLIL